MQKKLELPDQTIKEIVEELQTGMFVYLNLKTKEIKTLPEDTDSFSFDDESDPWKEDREDIENNPEEYLEFSPMDSNESFQIMSDFAASVDDERLRDKLELILDLAKPFRNFKSVIDDEPVYRKLWFEFRDQRYAEYIKTQIKLFNEDEDPDEEL
jgi:hypothetical protein